MEIMLNENQRMAVTHFKGPMMVLAGPGSGKTAVIAHRAKFLIDDRGVPPCDILIITFSKAAAEEMRQRFGDLPEKVNACRHTYTGGITFGTFHSHFFRIIRRHSGLAINGVLNEQAARDMLIRAMRESMRMHNDEELVDDIRKEISLVKNELLNIEYYYSPNMSGDLFRSVYNAYERLKESAGVIDFDDMLVKCHELLMTDPTVLEFWQNRYKFVLIDEFQDINRVQYECVKLLTAAHRNLFVVGDDDQSIYRFRGASPEFLLGFPGDFADTVKVVLDVNYRSSKRIINISGAVIKRNTRRYAKNIRGTERSGGELKLIKPSDIGGEALRIANIIKARPPGLDYDDYAVLFRTNIQARAFVDIFRDMNIPFKINDQMPSIYEHWIARDICAYMRLAVSDDQAGGEFDSDLVRIINRPKRYVSKELIHAARKNRRGIKRGLLSGSGMQPWQKQKFLELLDQLQMPGRLTAYDAIRFIRKTINYDSYINDYAEYRKLEPAGLYEVADEFTESAKGVGSIVDFLEYARKSAEEYKSVQQGAKKSGVTLSTIHGAKGLEFDTVFVAGMVEGLIPYKLSKLEPEIEEERRLLYVAITRARNNLYISTTSTRYDKEAKPSRFLEGIGGKP